MLINVNKKYKEEINMNKLKIGEYGRTNYGKIIIFAWLQDSNGKIDENKVILIKEDKLSNDFYYFTKGEKIVKHSEQLIDLIKIGDIVNGYRVDEVRINCFGGSIFLNDYETALHEEDIKEILTKEQFEANCYKVGGKDE